MTKPAIGFLGLGGERCGSTWYSEVLKAHPQLYVPRVKEVDFFSWNYHRGWDWYQRYFADDRALVSGEVSPSYLHHPEAAGRILSTYPDVRLICVLRNPFDRALSHLMLIAQTELGRLSELTARDLKSVAAKDDRYISRSLYAEALRPYVRSFGEDRLLLIEFTKIAEDPEGVSRSLYQFLGVDEAYVPPGLHQRVNDAKDYRWHALFRVLRGVSREAKRHRYSTRILESLQRLGVRRLVMGAFEERRRRPQVRFDDVFSGRDRLRVEEDMRELEDLIGPEFVSAWRQ